MLQTTYNQPLKTPHMKEIYTLAKLVSVFLFLFMTGIHAQTTIAVQDFEGVHGDNSAGDNWNPTIFPSPYFIGTDVWEEYTALYRINPKSNSKLWAMLDLDNPNNGQTPENTEHTLAFPNVSVSGEVNVLLSFYFNIESFDSNDYLRVEYFFDDVSQGIEDVGATIPSGTTSDWTEYSKAIPDGTTNVRFTIMAMMNTDYAAIDDIKLESNAVLSKERQSLENFSVYPNPVSNGILSINTLNNTTKKVSIFDTLGKQVYSKQLKANEKAYINHLNSGIYFLTVEENSITATKKLVIQ